MRSGQPGLNSNEYKALPIPLPPTKAEQTAIATALSDADAWIGSLEKLIEKKRLLKQGAMQELLKPKEGWVVKRLGEVLKVCHGKSQKEISVSTGKYPILASGGVIGTTNHFLHSGPSVLIGRKGTIDRPQFMDTPFWTVDTLFYTDIHEDFSPKYVFYKFCSIDWMSFNEASGVPSLNAKTIENIEVAFPPSLEEQELISISLSEFDSQILLLENQLSKARQIKQGMMQQLLTGKIRLI